MAVEQREDARLRGRSAEEVMADHLRCRRDGDLERDLEDNYHPDVVVMTARQLFRGHAGVRASAERLRAAVGTGTYSYDYVLADDRMVMLEWRAESERYRLTDAVDSNLVEDGWITAQTIHYRVEDLLLSVTGESLAQPGAVGPRPEGDDPARQHHLADPGR